MNTDGLHAIKASIVHCLNNPEHYGPDSLEYFADGLLLLDNGKVVQCGHADGISVPEQARLTDLSGKLVVPGLIDTHVHYPQVNMVAAYGKQLLEWLELYTFPTERFFSDQEHAANAARFFLDELLSNGTTTALVFGTVHPESVEAFFQEASSRQLRMICGKVMMDRHAPDYLLDSAESSFTQSQQLIDRWHERDRLGYAVTPRFAPTSSEEQLAVAGRLLRDNPTVHLHTHMAENADECDWVASLFPGSEDYLAVYERFDLVNRRSVFAHCVHLSDNAWRRLARHDAAVAHCPCSNLFIGSGLFDMRAAQKHRVRIGLGTDIGAGDSYSILRNINEAYKIQQLQRHTFTPEQAFYLATLGGATALDLQSRIGNFEPDKEADFLVIDEQATSALARRSRQVSTIRDRLFTWMMLGDERSVEQTWILGRRWAGNSNN